VLKEMEQQLQSSHQLTVQLRAQVRGPQGYMPARGQREARNTLRRLSTRGPHTPRVQSLPFPMAAWPRASFA
jgi:hypothetical protein